MSERKENFQKIQQRFKDFMEQNMDANDRNEPPSHHSEKKETTPKNPLPKAEAVNQPKKKAELEKLAQKEFNEFLIQPLKTKDTVEKIAIRKKLMAVLGPSMNYPLVPEPTQTENVLTRDFMTETVKKVVREEPQNDFKAETKKLQIPLKTETKELNTYPWEIKEPTHQDNQVNRREILKTIEQINYLTSKLKGLITAPPPPTAPPLLPPKFTSKAPNNLRGPLKCSLPISQASPVSGSCSSEAPAPPLSLKPLPKKASPSGCPPPPPPPPPPPMIASSKSQPKKNKKGSR